MTEPRIEMEGSRANEPGENLSGASTIAAGGDEQPQNPQPVYTRWLNRRARFSPALTQTAPLPKKTNLPRSHTISPQMSMLVLLALLLISLLAISIFSLGSLH